ncbi:ABC transporter ATP-binding protein [Comamonas sp. CMM02]|uniref:ABC transporter ATP-binding protein n=1 Tax=Comamonas sp. CMM02 TaxID=2769307 RepID=UPI00177FD639|nr:ABC transporter ATP-binding protein [Comamonas sp. CMM02]
MLKTFTQLLGNARPVFQRYLWLAVTYGLLCGLTISTLVPLLRSGLQGDTVTAVCWMLVLVLGVVTSWLWRRWVEKAGVQVGTAVVQAGRHRLGEQVARMPVGWFTPQNTARLEHVITQGMMSVAQLPAHVFTPLISGVITPIVLVITLWMLHPLLGVIALVALPLLAGAFALTTRLARGADTVFQRDFAQSSQRIVEFTQAQSVLRAFQGEAGSARFVQQAIALQQHSGLRVIGRSALSTVINTWAVQLVLAMLLVTCVAWLNGVVDAGLNLPEVVTVVVALLMVSRFIDPLLEVAGYADVLRAANMQLHDIASLLSVQPLPQPSGVQTLQQPQDASVTLHNVHFRYADDAPEVLRGVSLHAAPGSMTALIGVSGSGKSTVMRLLARFFDTSAGVVQLGGVDVRQLTDAQVAAHISQIFQDSYLLAGSIGENIRIGKSGATDSEVLHAAQRAGVSEIIARLPQGLNTQVGEGGVRLSGGERQRIAIARALLKDAPVFLVDEATSALDAENQQTIAQTLSWLKGRRTLIVIAHQLSTIAMADHVVVLEDGLVVEQGSPQALLALNGRYAQFLHQRNTTKGWRIASAKPPSMDKGPSCN